MRKLIVLGSLMLLLGTLAAGQQTKKKDGKAATSKTEAAGNVNAQIDQLRDAWVAAFNSKDAAKVADLYTSDAVYLNPGGTVRGRAAIKAAIQQSIQEGEHDATVTSRRREHSGDLVYDTGSYTQMSKDGKTQRGDYLVVIKQVGGKWLLAAHAANAAMAPAAGHRH